MSFEAQKFKNVWKFGAKILKKKTFLGPKFVLNLDFVMNQKIANISHCVKHATDIELWVYFRRLSRMAGHKIRLFQDNGNK